MKKRKILMGCGTVLAILALADCSAGYKKFNPATADNEEGSFMGRIYIYNHGQDITSSCSVGFNTNNIPWISLDESGLVFDKAGAGEVTLNRILCSSGSAYHYNPDGASFNNIGGESVTYFGDVVINWDFEGGLKTSSILFGAIGAAFESSSTNNEGILSMVVQDYGVDTAQNFREIANEEGRPKMLIRKSFMTAGH